MPARIVTLPGLRVLSPKGEVTALASGRQSRALLVYLAVERSASRDTLLGLFWPERDEVRARHSLSQTIYELRQALGEDCLRVTGDMVTACEDLETDVARFEAAVEHGRWAEALEVYGGGFLEGVHLTATHPFEEWLDRRRAQVARLHRRARREVVAARLAAADLPGALAVAQRWAELEPLDDEAQQRTIELLARTGHRAEALGHYERFRERLRREELEPMPELAQLAADIATGGLAPERPATSLPPTLSWPPTAPWPPATSLQPVTSLPPATTSPATATDYEILRLLGEGSMGRVFLARDPALQRLVTIKVPLAALAHDPIVRRRFEREARAAARVKHPGAVDIHRVGRAPDGTPFIVMEYVEGCTVADLLAAEGPLRTDLALNVLTQVADALAAAHAHGVIHRDVRPGNVLWEPQTQRAVLTDFGIAGILETGSEVVTRLTGEGQILGDPQHMSPEQLMGAPLTEASDIFGFGLMGFELLTGQQPYRVEGAEELARAHLQQAPRDLRDMLAGADPRLADLLARCLVTEPTRRPSARSLGRRLREIADAATPTPRPEGAALMDPMSGFPALISFVQELRRRRVVNVAILYLAAAYFLLTVAQLVMPALPAPKWVYPALVSVALAGFPVALVLGWLFDLTATGLRRTAGNRAPAGGGRRLLALQARGGALALALAAALAFWLL